LQLGQRVSNLRLYRGDIVVAEPETPSTDAPVTIDISVVREKCLKLKAEVEVPILESIQSKLN